MVGHLKKNNAGRLMKNAAGHLVKSCGPIVPPNCCIESLGEPIWGAFTPTSVTVPDIGGCCSILAGTYLLEEVNPCTFIKTINFSPEICVDPPDCEPGDFFQYYVDLITVGAYLQTDNKVSVRIYVEFRQTINFYCPTPFINAYFNRDIKYIRNCGVGEALYVNDGVNYLGCRPDSVTLA